MTRREPGSFFPSRLFLCFSSHYISLYLFEKHTSTSFPFLRRESNIRCHVVTLSRFHFPLRSYIITFNVLTFLFSHGRKNRGKKTGTLDLQNVKR